MEINDGTLAQLGEEWVIARAAKIFGTGGQWVGIGDDTAVTKIEKASAVTTVDLLVEGIHFRRETSSAYDVGWKAIAVNLSDIAAMGASPLWAVLGLALPKDTPGSWVEELFRGMKEISEKFGLSIVGGDTVGSPGKIFISLTVIGEAEKPVLRTGGLPGWQILVTGYAGASAAGLWLLENSEKIENSENLENIEDFARVIEKHRRPVPQIEAGKVIGRGEACLLDNSDGLFRSCQLLAEGSGLTARIDSKEIPIDEPTRRVAELAGVDPLDWALWGGEDYHLVAAVPNSRLAEISSSLEGLGVLCRVVGVLQAGDPKVLIDEKRLEAHPFRHF
ncbi:MAG TPA: thiamine-phosphate kinase [Cyanobacteria bacterium UBA8530]|nr:thiamine-phosphate kinase [Cyanobacteria bacterium UBA8530]